MADDMDTTPDQQVNKTSQAVSEEEKPKGTIDAPKTTEVPGSSAEESKDNNTEDIGEC